MRTASFAEELKRGAVHRIAELAYSRSLSSPCKVNQRSARKIISSWKCCRLNSIIESLAGKRRHQKIVATEPFRRRAS